MRPGTGLSGATLAPAYCETGHPVLRRTCGLEAGGTLENARAMAAQESPRTTKLYYRTADVHSMRLSGLQSKIATPVEPQGARNVCYWGSATHNNPSCPPCLCCCGCIASIRRRYLPSYTETTIRHRDGSNTRSRARLNDNFWCGVLPSNIVCLDVHHFCRYFP